MHINVSGQKLQPTNCKLQTQNIYTAASVLQQELQKGSVF
jgi:hypothetical protein